MNFVGYFLGVLLHVGFKWSSWKKKDRKWMAYWSEYMGLNISAGIAAIVMFGLWEIGWLGVVFQAIGNGIYSVAGAAMGSEVGKAPELPLTFWTSLFAGYILDSVARTITMRVQRAFYVKGKLPQ